jgi:hypothetical protein
LTHLGRAIFVFSKDVSFHVSKITKSRPSQRVCDSSKSGLVIVIRHRYRPIPTSHLEYVIIVEWMNCDENGFGENWHGKGHNSHQSPESAVSILVLVQDCVNLKEVLATTGFHCCLLSRRTR